jgi:hypothetical protein
LRLSIKSGKFRTHDRELMFRQRTLNEEVTEERTALR